MSTNNGLGVHVLLANSQYNIHTPTNYYQALKQNVLS